MHLRHILFVTALCLAADLTPAFASTGTGSGSSRSATEPDGWTVADPARLGWNLAPFAELERRVASDEWKGLTSVVVADHGQLVYERYFGDETRDTLNDMRSATKSVTSLLVGAAIDRGAISAVDAPAFPFFADQRPLANADPRKDAITIEDLLTMSSLLECDDSNPYSSGNEERMYVTESWLRFALEIPVKGFAPWMTKPADSPYGRSFSYCTAGSFVAGAVVERATKQRLDRFAADVLEKPLGIANAHWNLSPEGIGMGGGGVRYRSRDIAKIGAMVADGGRWKGKQIMSKRWIDATLTPHAQARDDAEYGYLFWRFHFPIDGKDTPVWAMSGNGGNYVFMLPARGLVAVVTARNYNQSFAHPQSQAIFREIVLKALPPMR
ncbi:MAG: serine hydrolase [Dokdonella sp.]|uniref:serine hydrolase domain-containing protein n=1 Tax=Dokdonella sp. TaxID=2291710 RepID=UPI0032639A92